MKQTEIFINMAPAEHKARVGALIKSAASWMDLRDVFLQLMTEYGNDLSCKPDDWAIDSHEAGGAWRPIFFHLKYKNNDVWLQKMAAVMKERRKYALSTFYHGFPDEAEIHHQIETFLYFQMPLWYHKLPGHEVALESILDLAEHVINAVDEVPPWYNWKEHGFRSTYLGTRSTRDYKPFDYQEGNHWRFADVALIAYKATSDSKYLELVEGYARTWCRHIHDDYEKGRVISCSILPTGAKATEMLHSGTQDSNMKEYQVFYWLAAANTAYDIVCGLLDVYRITGDEEFRRCAGLIIDQFFDNSIGARPAIFYSEGKWKQPFNPDAEASLTTAISQIETMLARMTMNYDLITSENRYKNAVIDWGKEIDEERWIADQTLISPLIAAWHYTKEEDYLFRAFAMALRLWAVTQDIDKPNMCNPRNRYGSKFLIENCYFPITGLWDAGTRGNIPVL